MWGDDVVPFSVELIGCEVDLGELLGGDLDAALVGVLVELSEHFEAFGGGRRSDQRDHGLAGDQRLASPVAGDEREQVMLDRGVSIYFR